jgi:hypothetical protein
VENSYRFRLFAGVIAYDSYRSELAGQRYSFLGSNGVILAITLPSFYRLLSHTAEKEKK